MKKKTNNKNSANTQNVSAGIKIMSARQKKLSAEEKIVSYQLV